MYDNVANAYLYQPYSLKDDRKKSPKHPQNQSCSCCILFPRLIMKSNFLLDRWLDKEFCLK